jgi:hypothetical protein
MGFFSKTCAKTFMPIVAELRGYPRFHNVVALRPNGEIVEGVYDGYGRVNNVELHDDWDKVKFVLSSAYNGESYNDLGKSGSELAQGWFMDNQFLLFCAMRDSFKSYAEYKKYFKKYANWL